MRPGSASFDVIQGTTPRIASAAGYSRKPVELVMTSRIEQCIGGYPGNPDTRIPHALEPLALVQTKSPSKPKTHEPI